MTPEHTLNRLLEAAQGHLAPAVIACLRDHLNALNRATSNERQACQATLDLWSAAHPAPPLMPGQPLGRYRYRGQPATAYEADGIVGLVLDSASDGQFRLRLPPPVDSPDAARPYVDAHWRHDDVAIRIEPGTYPALYRLDTGEWYLDHSPSAVPGLAPPLET